jgi:transcriptional regulator with XRE-family HTH domain
MSDEKIQREFGKRVGALRRRQGLTQDQLADVIGKSVDTVSNIERGFSSTRISTASSIASVLGVTLSDLFRPPADSEAERSRQILIDRLSGIIDGCNDSTLEAVIEVAAIVARVQERQLRAAILKEGTK